MSQDRLVLWMAKWAYTRAGMYQTQKWMWDVALFFVPSHLLFSLRANMSDSAWQMADGPDCFIEPCATTAEASHMCVYIHILQVY